MESTKFVRTVKQLEEMVEDLKNEPRLACDIETTSLEIEVMELDGIGIGTNTKVYYIPFPDFGLDVEQVVPFLNTLFETIPIIMHNAKFDMQGLRKFGFVTPTVIHDTMIMSWLVDEDTGHGLKNLTKILLEREVVEYKNLNLKEDLFTTKDDIMEVLGKYCGSDIANTYDLYDFFYPLLESDGLLKAYSLVEMPFVRVLADMEYRGVRLDTDGMTNLKERMEAVLENTQALIQLTLQDKTVNVASPTQLEKYLFDVLGYKSVRTTPAGKRSTDNGALEDIVKENKLDDSSFVALLLKFREYDKLYRTYMIGLLQKAGSSGIVHTNFLQHGTRTGRLSSSEPNLQNIPARHDDWEIRKYFVPREGYAFIVSDYSQVELRVLAHFSRDENMVQTFMDDGDIHAKTMELTGTERRAAKAINFGLIYGMGARSLAAALNIHENEAQDYMNRFFSGYPKVKAWINVVQKYALSQGFVTMITGRKRRFRNMFDQRWYSSVKRQSVNTKIQGSAADILKLAMLKMHKELPKYDAHILLQIHDEVVVEVPIDRMEEVKVVVRDLMESAVQLRVPLKLEWIPEIIG